MPNHRTTILFLLTLWPLSLVADDAPVKPQLELAKDGFEKAKKEAVKEMIKSFDTALKPLPGANLQAQLNRNKTIQEEKERFEKSGLVPWSHDMLPALVAYQTKIRLAENDLDKSFKKSIDAAIAAKNQALLAQLTAERDATIDHKPVAVWKVNKGQHDFYLSGRIKSDEGKARWTVDTHGKFVLHWPNKKAPGGEWVDTCKLDPLGQSFTGHNNRIHPKPMQIQGEYVTK